MDGDELRWTDPNDAPEDGTLVGGVLDPEDRDPRDLDPGATLDRYVVLSHMGTGGMGVVYSAYDPQLDRRIALKLMHQRGGDEAAAERASRRMLAEAKAMAQLSHPNVITVHDVGTIDGRVFIAMEFVEGVALSDWMRQRSREWQDILAVFVRAGRGLEAAHAAGLVHRDFKPDNVLVGVDGRVRVLDFGLARRIEVPVDAGLEPSERRDREAGTPAYMSPEQHLGEPVDHWSDQFSFAVAVYEALYSELPFTAKTRLELALAVTDGQVAPAPKRSAVPSWVRAALLRSLDPKPDARWPSMAALLDALTHDPRHKLRKAAVVTGLSAAAVASLALMFSAGAAQSRAVIAARPNQCSAANDRVAEVWNLQRREDLRETFAAVGEPWAVTLAREVEGGLTNWSSNWTTMHQQTCEASARGEQSDGLLDRRMLCLDRRLAEFDELVAVVSGTEAQSLARAGEAVRKLPDLSACSAAAIEAGDPTGDAEDSDEPVNELQRLIIDDLERDLFRANSLEMTGAFAEATGLVDTALDRARKFGDRRLIVAALLGRARIARARGKLEAVAVALEEAGLVAERAGDDPLRGAVMVARARAEWEAGDPEAALVRVQEARAVLERVGASPLAFATLDAIAARAAITPAALEQAEIDLRLAMHSISSDGRSDGTSEGTSEVAPVELAELQTSLGVVLRELGRFGPARTELEHAAGSWAEHYGGQHPVLASVGFELALVDDLEGRYDAALAGYAAVLPTFERAYGGNSLEVGRTSEAMAVVLGKLARFEEALRHHQRARAIFRAGLASEGVGRRLAAQALAQALTNEGVIRRELGQLDEALSLHQQALSLLERDWSVDTRASSRPAMLVDLAEVLLDLDRGVDARAPIDEALQLLATPTPTRARAQFVAARAWAGEPEPERRRARNLAREASKAFLRAGDPDSAAEVDRWLAALDGA